MIFAIRALCGIVAAFAAQRFVLTGEVIPFVLTIGAPWIGVIAGEK